MIMKVHLGSDFPRAVHLLLLGESGDGGPAQVGHLGEHLQDSKKKKQTRHRRDEYHAHGGVDEHCRGNRISNLGTGI